MPRSSGRLPVLPERNGHGMTTPRGVILDYDESEYHAHPALSATGAKLLVKPGGPARYQHEILHRNRQDKPAFDVGTAVHTLVLGTGSPLAVLDYEDRRTRAYKDAEAEARAAGKVPILKKDHAPILSMAESVLAHPKARGVFEQDGHPEATVFGTDPVTGVEVRSRFDWLAGVAADLKTAQDASPKGFAKAAAEWGYAVQRGFYRDAYQYATGLEAPEMVFVAVEKTAPYLVGVYQLDSEARTIGEIQTIYARGVFAECKRTNIWPGYSDEIELLALPFWAVREHEERFNV